MQKLGKLFETHDPRLVLIFCIQDNWKSKMSDKSCIKLPGVESNDFYTESTLLYTNVSFLRNAILDLLPEQMSPVSETLPIVLPTWRYPIFRFMSAAFRRTKNCSFRKVQKMSKFWAWILETEQLTGNQYGCKWPESGLWMQLPTN